MCLHQRHGPVQELAVGGVDGGLFFSDFCCRGCRPGVLAFVAVAPFDEVLDAEQQDFFLVLSENAPPGLADVEVDAQCDKT